MKRTLKSMPAPSELADHLHVNPLDDWDQFRDNRSAYKEVKKRLIEDQRGLCAYCEIDLEPKGKGREDFRVEHFYPKSPHRPPPNHALDWDNMLAVCTGGDDRSVADSAQRFTSPDHSCDVPKKDKNLVGAILNPLHDVPPFPRLFDYDGNGNIRVASACPVPLREKAANTIKELQLNAPRLQRFRKAVVEGLRTQLAGDMDMAMMSALLASAHLVVNDQGHWPAFLTCIRWYLDPQDVFLQEAGYQG